MLKVLLFLCALLVVSCANRQDVVLRTQEKVAPQVAVAGGNGGSIEDAVIISGVKNQSDGMDAEYNYIGTKNGIKNKDWRLVSQTIVQDHAKTFDVVEIELMSSSGHRIYYFDVSAFPWKKK